MICFIALIVFGIMGIFSSTHRELAKQAFDCVFRRATFRKCDTGFDAKIKTRISAGLLRKNKALGGFVFKHFEAISWTLTIVTIVSLLFTLVGVYNFIAFGNCNGEDSSAFCVYNALTGTNEPLNSGPITGTPTRDTGQLLGSESAVLTVVEFGCFSCPYTKSAEPFVLELLSEFDGRVNVLWKPFPLPNHPYSTEAALASLCADEQGKFVEYKALLFENQLLFREEGLAAFNQLAATAGLDGSQFAACLGSGKYLPQVQQTSREGQQLGLAGTPTFFVGSEVITGPQQYETLRAAVVRALAQLEETA